MKIISTDVVKIMERGQITLPIEMRNILGLEAKSLVVVQLTDTKNLIIQPLQQKKASLQDFIEEMSQDKNIYWTEEDEKLRLKNRKNSLQRIDKMWNEHTR